MNVASPTLESLLNIEFDKYDSFIKAVKNINPKLAKKYTYELLEIALADEKVKQDVEKWKGWKLGNLAPYYEPIAWLFKPYDSVVTLTDNVLVNEVGAINMNVGKINGREPKNILKFDFTNEEEKVHDAQKPIELIKYLINIMTREGQVILDPFVGSGTTAVAAKELNRNFIAFEINEQYHSLANKRLNQEDKKEHQIALEI